MCVGLAMQVIDVQGPSALCEYQGQKLTIDMMLVGDQPIGTWVLVFLDTAREVISPVRAKQINDALTALQLAMQGETHFDDLFADLVNRSPELPEFLR